MFSKLLRQQVPKLMMKNAVSQRSFAAGKKIVMGQQARQLMLEGCAKLADAVSVTLGPRGRNVIIDQTFGTPKITKDGVTVAKNINFSNRYHNMGASLVKQVANNTNDEAGDGTTTATILAHHIYKHGVKELLHGGNATEIRKGIMKAVEAIVSQLKQQSHQINSEEDIANVATISANNDSSIGQLIGQAMNKLGKEGTITVQDGKTLETEIEYVEGMRFDRGYISPYFQTNEKDQKCQFDNPLILFIEKKLSNSIHTARIMEAAYATKEPLVIVAEDIESDSLSTMILNRLRANIKIVGVKAPGFGDNRKNTVGDLALACGGEVISEELGHSLDEVCKSPQNISAFFGRAKKVIISKDETIIIEGKADQKIITDRIAALEGQKQSLTSDYDKQKITQRIGRLTGKVATIKVGGSSDVEVSQLKDRINDALCATRAAIEQGIVAGGGVALLSCQDKLNGLKTDNSDQATGVKIVRDAIIQPIMKICENAEVSGEVIINKLNEMKKQNWGYDAQTGEYKDLIKAGIIDPTKVVKTALVDASGVASLMLTTECMIVEEEEKQKAGAGGPGAGGMGMGGLDM